ncbi:hypothetical protein Tco_1298421 [Tanacetum coccineum]
MSNQTNELKNMTASFFQMNTASSLGTGPLPSNTIANPRGNLKAITTRSGIVLDGPSVLIPHPFINPEEDERVEETLTDPELIEYTIKRYDDADDDLLFESQRPIMMNGEKFYDDPFDSKENKIKVSKLLVDELDSTQIKITLDFEASRAHGFVHHSLELHILSLIMGIEYPNLID